MKIDRMIGILAILLQREQVTAPELASRFEVSRRTISRDIDALARAGVPVTTIRGAGGGISVMPGYRCLLYTSFFYPVRPESFFKLLRIFCYTFLFSKNLIMRIERPGKNKRQL